MNNGDHKAEIFMDGINADRKGEDYKKVIKYLRNNDKEIIKMSPGGGWVASIISAQ